MPALATSAGGTCSGTNDSETYDEVLGCSIQNFLTMDISDINLRVFLIATKIHCDEKTMRRKDPATKRPCDKKTRDEKVATKRLRRK